MKNQAKLKNWGLEEKYYYLKFGAQPGTPIFAIGGIATVCVIPAAHNPGGVIYARGVSFCNPKDTLIKKKGRNIALGRAVLAIEKCENNDYISKTTPAIILSKNLGWVALSVWGAALTDFEKRLFAREAERTGRIPEDTNILPMHADFKEEG